MVTVMTEPEATVLYDEDCGFCKWSLDKILAWDRSRLLRPVPIQGEEGDALLAAVPSERRLDSWHLVERDGTVHSGGQAASTLFELLPGGSPLAFLTRKFPGTTDRAYRRVAGNRDRVARRLGIDSSCQVRRR